jgi:26S proteasome regulatory subunit N9
VTKEMTYLSQKVRIIAFLELLFASGQHDMQISFKRIAETCQVSKDDVELLVMKAQSLDLIRGSID